MAIVDKELPFLRSFFPKTKPNAPETFKSAAVVGARGKTGSLFGSTLDEVVPMQPANRGEVTSVLAGMPELVIVATPNPIKAVAQELAAGVAGPTTFLFTQNGVDVLPTIQEAFAEVKHPVTVVRGSLFTTVGKDPEGQLIYKKRIGLALAGEDPNNSFPRVADMFTQAQYAVLEADDPKGLEWAKLETNMLGLTAAVTGFSPRETFRNKALFKLEVEALRERRKLLREAGIQTAKTPWSKQFDLLESVPEAVLTSMPVRYLAAKIFSKGRNNQPPAMAVLVNENGAKPKEERKPLEAIDYYFKPFIELAEQYGYSDALDRAVQRILEAHQVSERRINLTEMTTKERVKLLRDTVQAYKVDAYTPGRKGLARLAEGLVRWGLRSLTVTEEGQKNLDQMVQYLQEGGSVQFLANHSSHADHAVLEMVVKDKLKGRMPEDSMFIVAGMLWGKDLVSKVFENTYGKLRVTTPKKGASPVEKLLADIINKKSIPEEDKLLAGANIELIYAEGSRAVALEEPIPAVSLRFGHDNTKAVFYAAVVGTADLQAPRDKNKTGWGLKLDVLKNVLRLAIPNRANVLVHVFEEMHPGRRDVKAMHSMWEDIAAYQPAHLRGPFGRQPDSKAV